SSEQEGIPFCNVRYIFANQDQDNATRSLQQATKSRVRQGAERPDIAIKGKDPGKGEFAGLQQATLYSHLRMCD
ncbi:MAG: hypothetical protein ACXVKL_16195, partial [Candidatus Angelobacter sp.]